MVNLCPLDNRRRGCTCEDLYVKLSNGRKKTGVGKSSVQRTRGKYFLNLQGKSRENTDVGKYAARQVVYVKIYLGKLSNGQENQCGEICRTADKRYIISQSQEKSRKKTTAGLNKLYFE